MFNWVMDNLNTVIFSFIVLAFVSKVIWTLLLDYEPFMIWKSLFVNGIEDKYAKWKNTSTLRKIYFCLLFLIIPVFLYSLIVLFPDFLRKRNDINTSFNDLSLAVFAVFSGFGALFGFYTTIVRTEIAEQGLITDRINKATESLSKINQKDHPVVEARLGALYALERIAQDSIRDHISIIEILCAYIRCNSGHDIENNPMKPLREDIQAAMIIIGRRETWPEGKKRIDIEGYREYKIKLIGCDLHDLRLSEANLNDAEFGGSNLRGTFLDEADLTDAVFDYADMSEALICNSDISGASFCGTNMEATSTEWAYAEKCDILFAEGLKQDQIDEMFLGKDVELPDGLNHPQEGTKYFKDYPTFNDFFAAYEKWADEEKEKKHAHPRQNKNL